MFHFLSWAAQWVLRAANESIVIYVDNTSIGKKKNRVKGNHFHSQDFPILPGEVQKKRFSSLLETLRLVANYLINGYFYSINELDFLLRGTLDRV
jgi:hypothetical protein